MDSEKQDLSKNNYLTKLVKELLLILLFTISGVILLFILRAWNITHSLFGSLIPHILIYIAFIGIGLVLYGIKRHREYIKHNHEWKRLESGLRQSEESYRTTLDALDVPMHVVDSHLNIILVNKAFLNWVRHYGQSDDILGKNLKDIYGFLSPITWAEYNTVMDKGKIYLTEEKVVLNGQEILTETKKIPVIEDNKVQRIITIIHDVTFRKRMENERESYQRLSISLSLIHSIRELSILLSREAKFMFNYDSYYFDLYDAEKKYLKNIYAEDTPSDGMNTREVPVEDSYDENDSVLNLISGKAKLTNRNEEVNLEQLQLRPFGFTERRSRSIMVAPLRSDSKIAAVVSVQSYHVNQYMQEDLEVFQTLINQCEAAFNRILAEEELRKTNLNLEHKIHERTAALSKSNSMLVREISERKEIESILKENQRKLYTLLENLPGVAYRCRYDSHWTMEYISENCLELLGYRPSDILFNHRIEFNELIHPEDRENVHNTINKAVENDVPFEIVYRIRTVFGDIKWVFEKGVGVRAEDGVIQAVEGFLQDITQEHLDNAQMKASGERYRKMVESVTDWFWEINPEGRYTYVSPRIQNILGYSPDEVLGKTPFDLMSEEEACRISPIFKQYENEKKEFHLLVNKAIHKEGYQVVLETNGTPIYDDEGNYAGYRGMDRDITQKTKDEKIGRQRDYQIMKQHSALLELANENDSTEQSLTDSLERICQIVSKSMDADRVSIWLQSVEGDFPRLKAEYDLKENQYPPALHVIQDEHFNQLWKHILSKGTFFYDSLSSLTDFQEEWLAYLTDHCLLSGGFVPVQLAGKITGVLCCFYRNAGRKWEPFEIEFLETVAYHILSKEQQWEKKKDAETLKLLSEELAQQLRLFDEVLEGSPDPVALFDTEGRILYANMNAAEQIGAKPEALVGKTFLELGFPKEYDDELLEQIRTSIKTMRFLRDESLIHTQDGDKWFEYILKPLHSLDGTIKTVLLTARDITVRVKYEEDLKHINEDRKELESIINRSSILFFSWKPEVDLPVEYVSENIKQYKYTPDDFYQGRQSFFNIIHPDDRSKLRECISKLNHTGIYSIREQFRLITSYKAERWVDGLIWVRYDTENKSAQYQGILEDITDKKEAQDALKMSEEKYRALAESAQDYIFIINSESQIVYANEYTSRQVGIPVGELPGKNIFTILEPGLHNKVERSIHELLKSKTPTSISDRFIINGKETFLESVITPLLDGEDNVRSLLVISRDITQRKLAERKIEALNQELEGRLKELNDANNDLESFNSMVTHDLRGKLSIISGYFSLHKGHLGDNLDLITDHHLEVINRNIIRMDEMINDLLALSRFNKKDMTLQEVDMGKLVNTLITEQAETLSNRKIQFIQNDMPIAFGDESLISEVLMNLISNAIKYTRVRETAVIEIGGWEGNSQSVYYIKDNGIGFDMKYADQLFNVFQRLHKESEYEGTGVGLTIVQKILNRHGGSIWFEAQPDQGATFFFTLPARSKPEPII